MIAAGGGAPLDPANRRVFRESGHVVWLDADVDTLLARRVEGDRPSLTGAPLAEEIAKVSATRRPIYEAAAHRRIAVDDLDLESLVDMLEEIWRRCVMPS